MPNITQEPTESDKFLIDASVKTINKLKAGFVEANKNYIKNSLLGIVYHAIDNFDILTETQQTNITILKQQLLYGGGTC